ncbi:DUF58 domain-containing protein [Sphingomonas sp. CJ20]
MTAPSLSFEALFDPDFLARVQQFALSASRVEKGGRLADQSSSARGQGIDFADFRPYVPGDDLRAIDWNIYRRLDRLFVRVFEERQDMPVYFLIDISRSMFTGESPRIHAGLRTTLALAAIVLGQHDSVALFPFSDAMTVQTRNLSGKASLMRVARHLADYQSAGGTALALSIERLASMRLRRGLVVIVSDFFDDSGLDQVLPALGLLQHRILLVQLTRPEDSDPTRHPALAGDVAIEDAETGRQIELTITPEVLERYRQAYRAFSEELLAHSLTYGHALARIDASRDVLEQLGELFLGGRLAI